MLVHDWTCVEAGIFHAFHVSWIPEMQKALNAGVLPRGYYALAEQHTGRAIADLLTLHVEPAIQAPLPHPPAPDSGGVALAEVPPRVRYRETVELSAPARQRSLAIRHVSGHRLVAIVEIVSPANKDRQRNVEDFAEKVVSALDAGVNLLVIDLFPPGPYDLYGMHAAIRQRLDGGQHSPNEPNDEPLVVVSYAAGPRVEVYLEHVAVGTELPDMPLFLNPDYYVLAPLAPTYRAAFEGLPLYWRGVLEGHSPGAA